MEAAKSDLIQRFLESSKSASFPWKTAYDGLFFRKYNALRKKKAQQVVPRSTVTIHYESYLIEASEGGHQLKELDKSANFSFEPKPSVEPTGKPLTYIVDSGSIIDAWDTCLLPRKGYDGSFVGEIIEIVSAPAFAYGGDGRIYIESCMPEQMRDPDVIQKARSLKEAGNKLFQDGKIAEAEISYTEAIHLFKFFLTESKEEEDSVMSIKLVCLVNRAACELRMENFAGAKKSCNLALKIDSKNIKALYRRATASAALFDFERALNDILSAIKLNPNDASLRQEFQKIKLKRDEYDKQNQEALKQIGADGINK